MKGEGTRLAPEGLGLHQRTLRLVGPERARPRPRPPSRRSAKDAAPSTRTHQRLQGLGEPESCFIPEPRVRVWLAWGLH